MTFRQIILFGIGLFMLVLVGDTVYTYYHPWIASETAHVTFKILLSISFGVGGVYTLSAFRKNVTTAIKAEQRDIVKEGRYRKRVEESGITTISTNAQGIVKFVSKNVTKLCGYTPDEMRGLHVTACMPAEFRPQVHMLITNAAAESEYNTTIEIQIFTKERINKWIACRLYNITDDKGDLKEIQFMIWDNDYSKLLELELKHLEEARIKQQKLLQDVIDNNPNIIYIKNLEGEYVLTNKKMQDMAGPADNKVNAADYFEVTGKQLELYEQLDKQVVAEKRSVSIEDSFPYKGETKYYYVTKFPMFDNEGEVEYICGVSVDISELKHTQLQMLEAREEAMQAKEAQENFLANMSHEIRTPMNGVMGMSNLLLETKLDEPQEEYVRSIKESAENLLSIINDLLDFSKIKSGKFHIDDQDFDIADTVRKAIYPIQIKAQEKNLTLNCLIDTGVPETVTGDALRLQQMIINLAANAVKFTQKGSVTVKLSPQEVKEHDMLLRIEVADTGIGIAENKLDHVFELYTQSEKTTSRVYGGTGLGLAIVKQLAELQNGSVSVKSELDKGTVFTVLIPYKVKNTTPAKIQTTTINNKTAGVLQGLHILVAEDNLINQKVVMYTLKNQGATVSMANNGKEAVTMLDTDTYDLILMDLQMPEMDGYQATHHIRNEMGMQIPIIAMTADAMKGESDKCINAGMQDYVSKPFEPQELFTKILTYTSRVTIR